METVFKSADKTGCTTGIHVSHRAPVPDVLLKQEVGQAIPWSTVYTFGVVGEVDDSVLDSLMIGG